jgi:hypothetical protein
MHKYFEIENSIKSTSIDYNDIMLEIEKERSELDKMRIKRRLSKEEAKIEGKNYVMEAPQPRTATEAYNILFGFHAVGYYLFEKGAFALTNPVITEIEVDKELYSINDFIEQANKLTPLEIDKYFREKKDVHKLNLALYRKIESGYYKHLKFIDYPGMGQVNAELYVIGRIKYFREWLLELKEKHFNANSNNRQPEPEIIKRKDTHKVSPLTIHVIPEKREQFYNVFKNYFDKSYHAQLSKLLSGNTIDCKLAFSGNLIQLGDTFKKLSFHKIIVGANKRELVKWMSNNFLYDSDKPVKESAFKNYSFSSDESIGNSPIIEVEADTKDISIA